MLYCLLKRQQAIRGHLASLPNTSGEGRQLCHTYQPRNVSSSHNSFLSLMFCILFFTNSSDSANTDDRRLEQLSQLRKSSTKGLIPFNVDMFETFIGTSPRAYGVLIILTAPPQMCQICTRMTKQLSHVSAEYYKLPSNRAAANPLFFAELKLSQRDQMFLAKYRVRHVPILYYCPPGQKDFAQPLEKESPNYYPAETLGIGANAIREYVNTRTGSRLKVLKGNYKISFVETVRLFQSVILLIVGILGAISIYTRAYKSPMFWLGLVALIYIFSVGGGHYSWIHNVPLVVINKEGRTEYIAVGSRSQYVAEGFFVSVTCVSISVLVILIQELPSVLPDTEAQTLAGAVLFVMIIFAITVLQVMYHLKMPQYLHYSELS